MICVLILGLQHPKVHRKWFYGEAGNRSWCTRHRLSPYTTANAASDQGLHCLLTRCSITI